MENDAELNVPKFVSAEKYSKLTGLGLAEVKKLCRTQKITGAYISEGGYYKIPVYSNNVVPKEEYEELKKENTMLKEKLKNIFLISKGGENEWIEKTFLLKRYRERGNENE